LVPIFQDREVVAAGVGYDDRPGVPGPRARAIVIGWIPRLDAVRSSVEVV
jgi:hypothetical protein